MSISQASSADFVFSAAVLSMENKIDSLRPGRNDRIDARGRKFVVTGLRGSRLQQVRLHFTIADGMCKSGTQSTHSAGL